MATGDGADGAGWLPGWGLALGRGHDPENQDKTL